jgi:hypothetical protein
METLQYDGMGELHVKSLDDWIKFSSSKYFLDVMSSMSSHSILPFTVLFHGKKVLQGDPSGSVLTFGGDCMC